MEELNLFTGSQCEKRQSKVMFKTKQSVEKHVAAVLNQLSTEREVGNLYLFIVVYFVSLRRWKQLMLYMSGQF